MIAIGFGLLRRPVVRWGLIGLVGVEAIVVVGLYAVERIDLKRRENEVTYNKNQAVYLRKYPARGLRTPPALPALEATIDPSEIVIGVVVGGKARAYRLGALSDRDRHVVNDVVGGSAVSIVYCSISDCVRVYVDKATPTPLDIATAGRIEGEMIVRMGEHYYLQSSGEPVTAEAAPSPSTPPIPYETLPPQRMHWGEWLRLHPETDVFVGVPKRVGE